MTEIWQKCDIMKIIKYTDVKKTHDCASSVGRTLAPSSLSRLGKTLVISLIYNYNTQPRYNGAFSCKCKKSRVTCLFVHKEDKDCARFIGFK